MFEIFTSVMIHIVVFCVRTQCNLVGGQQYSAKTEVTYTLNMEAVCLSRKRVTINQIITLKSIV